MQKKQSVSVPRVGMKRDTHISQLQQTDYVFLMNGSVESEDGNSLNISNEPSNTLSVNFPSGYKVIGFKKDVLNEKTYYFLTNPEIKKSSIGYVNDKKAETYNEDLYQDCGDCNGQNEITPQGTETADNTYIELLNDVCHSVGDGLNFDLNFPIKFVEIKNEKLSTTLYWNDYNNPPRYLVVSDISYLYTIEVPCGEDVITDCLIVDKLLQFPKHTSMKINPEVIQTGGNLKMGTYEFYATYCDMQGNELTDYCTPTNPVSIFDENNNILSQTTLDQFTNFAIKLKIEDLDTRFKYYKVVCVERNNVNNSQSAFLAGVYPTTDDTVLYTSSGSINDDGKIAVGNSSLNIRVEPFTLGLQKLQIEKAKGDVAINNKKFMFGLKVREELNLQPVVNLFGSLLKWQTSVAKEDLYKPSIATSKYVGYRRDEVYPFGIRFLYKDGGKTAVFPLIGRPTNEDDLEIVSETDKNFLSLSENSASCSTTERNKKWQIFNTATQTGFCSDPNGDGTEIQEDLQRSCTIEDVFTIPIDTITIEINDNYTNLEDYINDNYDEVIDPTNTKLYNAIGQYLVDEYPDDNCTPSFPSYNQANIIQTGEAYKIETLQTGDAFSNIGYVSEGVDFTATGDTPTNWTNGTIVLRRVCDIPVLDSQRVLVSAVENEQVTLIEKDETTYVKSKAPQFCQVYETDASGKKIKNEDFIESYLPCGSIIYKRITPDNEDCNYANNVINNNDPTTASVGYYLDYEGDTVLTNLESSKYAFVTDANFNAKLHRKAVWFKINKLGRDKIIFEITKNSSCLAKEDIIGSVNKLRYSFYEDCSETTSIGGAIINTTIGTLVEVDTTTFPDVFYVAIDAPIIQTTSQIEPCDSVTINANITTYVLAPPCGCFSIFTRDVEYTEATISWDSVTLDKVQTYISECTFFLPKLDDCEPKPFANGEFAYWQSTEEYPDNEELYDSSTLKIKPSDLSDEERPRFESFYTNSGALDVNGNYILKNVDFRCKPVRHFKMPDNIVTSFISSSGVVSLAETLIYPLGVSIDENSVVSMLNVALSNNLITLKQLNNIESFEILRGDNSIQKSVIANGLAYDMYKYQQKNNTYLYANYPHNDLGDDLLHYTNSNRNTLIPHPYIGAGNNNFSILSPDLLLTYPQIPSEMVLSGFQLGSSLTTFTDVEDHPKWTILGKDARTTATVLAFAEFALEVTIKYLEFTTQSGVGNIWFFGGAFGVGSNATGAGVSAGLIAAFVGTQILAGYPRIGQYRYQWLKTFRDLGTSYNFASYAVSKGYHNLFLPNTSSADYVRALTVRKHMRDGRYNYRDSITGDKLLVNNKLREYATFVSTGNYDFEYTTDYRNYDNNKLSPEQGSKTILSQNDCELNQENQRNVGSPYVTLRNYIPDQFGKIDSVKWLTTNYIYKIGQPSACETIFGGNVFISRFSWKRKLPIFTTTAMGLPDKLAFEYSKYKNIGVPKFYCDYETDSEYNGLLIPFPDIDSNYTFDCERGRNSFYVKPPSKLYLYYYGITDFLVESEINCNFRYGKVEPRDNFYPNVGDVMEWTQQKNVPIKEPNTFFYNNVYSLPVSNTPFRRLAFDYNKEEYFKRSVQDNAVVYSEIDNSENNVFSDPWLVYKPLNRHEFSTKYGKLQRIQNLQGQQILGLFSDQAVVFNKVDNLADRITPQTSVTGTSGIFTSRPAEFSLTDLGFAGTQNSELANTPYGNFYVDAKRGKIWKVDPSGGGLEPISDSVGNNPSSMKNWFREHLPFKILKQFPQVDVDNKFKGIGFNIWYDARFDRVFFTKKDVVAKSSCVRYEDGEFFSNCEESDCENDNLIVNGNFDTDLSGWSFVYEEQYVWLDGKAWFNESNDQTASMFQDILEVGKTYKISFNVYSTIDDGIFKSVKVFAGGNESQEFLINGDTTIDIEMECTGSNLFRIDTIFTSYILDISKRIAIDNVCVIEKNPKKKIEVTNSKYFEDVSWTIAFNPMIGWVSYYSFKPNFTVAHQDYFTSSENLGTLWNHYLNNKSFQKFYGRQEAFIIEYPVQNGNIRKELLSLSLNLEARRWQDEWNFAENRSVGFNKLNIYNHTNNSGVLNLVEQKTLSQKSQYPKTNNNNTQDILFTAEEGKHNINYFYNRVKNQDNNVPHFLWDKNRIEKQINPQAVSFFGKKQLERLRGETFIVRLINDNNTDYQITLKNSIQTENGDA